MSLRPAHSAVGLIAAFVVSFMAVTGALLSLKGAVAEFQQTVTTSESNAPSVAGLAAMVKERHPNSVRLVRAPSGSVIVHSVAKQGQAAEFVDASSGKGIADYRPSPFFTTLGELHRSLFLGTPGRLATGVSALALFILSLSGAVMLAVRLGGWRNLLCPVRGSIVQRLHVDLGRIALFVLVLASTTGFYMSLAGFGVIADGTETPPPFPETVNGGPAIAIADLTALAAIPLTDLRELVFPFPDDALDVFTVTTASGQGFVDQATGAMLSFQPNNVAKVLQETIYMLHTGDGVWWFGLLLGALILCVPVISATGAMIWWLRSRNRPKISGNVPSSVADTVILVGSEGNSTWGFAADLLGELTRSGHKVHICPMNEIRDRYRCADRMFILTATYGDGQAPASAGRFLERLATFENTAPLKVAVVGFGDRRFSQFCKFATDVEVACIARGMDVLLPLETVDRHSLQTFANWGRALGVVIGAPLDLTHVPVLPRTSALTLSKRTEYGCDLGAQTTILRFTVDGSTSPTGAITSGSNHLPKFEAGDLFGIVPPGSELPRYYSLASGSNDGYLEICVRQQAGGVCSEFLHGLQLGDTIAAFIRPNTGFRPIAGKAPVILIGAGTGIAPLAGFIRKNSGRRPFHLYWGGRNPQSDFLYRDTLAQCLRDCRLTRLVTAFSRIAGGSYVQDKLQENAQEIRDLVAHGAQIVVCGGRGMARGVNEAINEIVSPLGLSVQTLRNERRYIEDVY